MDTPQAKIATPALERTRFHLAEHYQQNYVAVVPQGTDPHALEDPAFWANVAFMCRSSGRIFVECEDGTWLADLYIRAVGPQFVMARILNVWTDNYAPPPVVDGNKVRGYTIKWAGPHARYRVVRDNDGAVIHEKAESQAVAEAWLSEHMKAAAR